MIDKIVFALLYLICLFGTIPVALMADSDSALAAFYGWAFLTYYSGIPFGLRGQFILFALPFCIWFLILLGVGALALWAVATPSPPRSPTSCSWTK